MKLSRRKIKGLKVYSLILSLCLILVLGASVFIRMQNNASADPIFAPVTNDTVIYQGKIDGVNKTYVFGDATESWDIGLSETNMMVVAYYDDDKVLIFYGSDEFLYADVAVPYTSTTQSTKKLLTYNFKPLGNINNMFANISCYPTSLNTIDLTGFDASEVTSMNGTFQNIGTNGQSLSYTSHTSILFPKHFNTDKVLSIDGIFNNAFVGSDIDVTWPEEILFPNAVSAETAFVYVLNSSKDDYDFNFLEHFDFSKIENADGMFSGMFMYSAGDLNLSFKDKNKVFQTNDTEIDGIFGGFCQGTHGNVKVDFGKGISFAPDTYIYSFWPNLGIGSEGNIEVYFGDHFDGSNVTKVNSLFGSVFCSSYCSYKLDFGKHFDFSNTTFERSLFEALGSSSTNGDIYIDLGDNFDVSGLNGQSLFSNSFSALTADNVTIDFGDNFNASNLGEEDRIFMSSFSSSQIENLTIYFGKHFDISNKESLEKIFNNSFKTIKTNKFILDFGENFDIKDGISAKDMFKSSFIDIKKIGDDSEFVIDFNKFDGSQFGLLENMFFGAFSGMQMDNVLVDFGDNFNACNATSAFDMFAMSFQGQIENLKIDCGKNFNLCSATNVRYMFYEIGFNTGTIKNLVLDLGDNFNACSATQVDCFALSYSYVTDDIKFYGGKNLNMCSCTNFNYFMSSIASSGAYNIKPNIYIDLGDNFNAISGENFMYAFERIGYDSTGKDIYINLGKNFNKSDGPDFVPKAQNMQSMFAYIGYNAKGFHLDLGENFITDNVSTFNYMFGSVLGWCSNTDKFELTFPKSMKFDNAVNISQMFSPILGNGSCNDVLITFNNDFHFTKNCDASIFMKESFYLADNIKIVFNGDIIVEPDASVSFWEAFRNVGQSHSVNTIIEFNGDVILKGNTNITQMFQYFGGYYSFWGPGTKTRITFNKDLDLSGVTSASELFQQTSIPKEESIVEVKGHVTPSVLTNASSIFNMANIDTIHLDYFNFDGGEGSDVASFAKTWSIVLNNDSQNNGNYYFNNSNDLGTSKWYAVSLDADNKEVYTYVGASGVFNTPGAIRYDRIGQLDNPNGLASIDRFDGQSKPLFTIDTAHSIGDLYDITFRIFSNGVDHLEEGIDYEVEAINGDSLDEPTAPGETIQIQLKGINRYEKFIEKTLVIEPYEIKPEDLELEYVTEENPVIKKQDGSSKITSSLKMVYTNPKTGEKVYFDVNEGNYTKDGSNYSKSDSNPLDITIKGLKTSSKNTQETLNKYTLASVNNYNVPMTFNKVGKIDKNDDNGNGGNGGSKTITTSTITVQVTDPVIKGYSDNTIRPNNNITRQEFITMLSRLDSSYGKNIDYTKHINSFSDIVTNNNIYAKNEIGYYIYKGIIKGYPDNSFKPNGLITRAEASKVLCMYKNIDAYTNVDLSKVVNQFNDVTNSNWFTGYVAALYNKGYINGRKQNSFEPNGYLTRAEAAKLICLLENRNINNVNITEQNTLLNKYKDLNKNEWYFPYIYQLAR